MSAPLCEVYLARHGETAWTVTGQHTGLTDLRLTPRGERNARSLGERLLGVAFEKVLTSPLQRARRTCELAGFGARAELDNDLIELNYGEYEGRTLDDIRRERPGWDVFQDGCPGGENPDGIGVRADRVISRLRGSAGRILMFGHGHFFRVLAARWILLAASDARHFVLSTAALSILGYEHSQAEPAILLWNDCRHTVD